MENQQPHSLFSSTISWQEAVEDFLLQTRGAREETTERYYTERLKLLVRWAEGEGITLSDFRARHLRQYLAHRGARPPSGHYSDEYAEKKEAV